MPPTLSPQTFVEKWDRVTVNEKAAAQSHFNDLCDLLGVPKPLDADQRGIWYRFEKPLSKVGGGAGFADVWRDGTFVWEYKTRGKSLDLARQQIQAYRGDLGNPPITVLCDTTRYEVYVEFTGYKTRVEMFTNADLLNAGIRDLLRAALTDPQRLRPSDKTFTITERVAAKFAQVAQLVEQRGHDPHDVAHYFMKLLFAMFAEDVGLLPNALFSQTLKAAIFDPDAFNAMIRPLFGQMRTGGYWGPGNAIPHFNGGLFADDFAIPLKVDDLQFLYDAAQQDWRDVEPAIFGTLFERSLDPTKRSQLGAHYTSRDDILLLVEPVLMQPLRHQWADTRVEVEALRPQYDAATGVPRQRFKNQIMDRLLAMSERLSTITVLDPACGSGNFLYVALQALKDLEKEVITYAVAIGVDEIGQAVSPRQLHGIEKNPFAAELAQVVVWIGDLQWNVKNGFPNDRRPVLQTLDTIHCADAILTYDADTGQPVEPQWPAADVIIGNPPFLGGNKIRKELGNHTVDTLFKLYDGRVPAFADLVCYWFEKARVQIEQGRAQRAGLIATQAIRGGANRKVLQRIKQTGDIFYAWADRPWVLDGAMVHVSMVGFDDGSAQNRSLNGQPAIMVNADLTGAVDLTVAQHLPENKDICYRTDEKGGPFDIDDQLARQMLAAPLNPNGRPNSDVVRPYVNSIDVTRRPRNMWVIDFGIDTTKEAASLYEVPFRYVEQHVEPIRATNNVPRLREQWWIHRIPGANMRAVLAKLQRFIVTPSVAKHRLFVWLDSATIPDHQLYAFAREDDYFFGVLHSRLHELWARATGTQLREAESGFRYTPTTTFETFPFPWAPGHEPHDDPQVHAIAIAARMLAQQRDAWLNPPDLFGNSAGAKDRTLTNLYNRCPDWLTAAHAVLDRAVLDAYGWPHDLSDDEILQRLLDLNLARAGVTINV